MWVQKDVVSQNLSVSGEDIHTDLDINRQQVQYLTLVSPDGSFVMMTLCYASTL